MDADEYQMLREELTRAAEGWPATLARALSDVYDFTVGLRDGSVVRFTHAEVSASPGWVILKGVSKPPWSPPVGTYFGWSRGLEVRISDIMWCGDAES